MITPEPPAAAPRIRRAAAAAIVVALTAIVYWPALHAGFHADDYMILHRLRALSGPGDVLRFFRGEFFEYYRPLPFVLHALDWAAAGANAWRFHLTNLVLHGASTVLVMLIARRLSSSTWAPPLAGLLFALHAASHEPVVWISARFDLLATLFALAAIWCLVCDTRGSRAAAPLLFFCAILSKESAVALPIAAAAFWVFTGRTALTTARRLAPWILALMAYALLRNLAGGVSPVGGASRLPKLLALGVMLSGLLLLAGQRWLDVRRWLLAHRGVSLGALAAAIIALAMAASTAGRLGRLAAAKLAVAGFAAFNLVSPLIDLEQPFYLDEQSVLYWAGGAIALLAGIALLAWLWNVLIEDERMWFFAALLAATLLPISALTEGTRYLYLPSAAVALAVGVFAAERRGTSRSGAFALVAALLVVSAVQIRLKLRDWKWAGELTASGAQLVDSTRTADCGEDHVVFLTEPVAVRGVYTHFYYETFELPRGCMPGEFDVLVRMMRLDGRVDVRWDGPSRIVITAPEYRDNFVVAADLRHFDIPLRGRERTMSLRTPLGELRAEAEGEAERLTLTLAAGERHERVRFFYYSEGRVRPLAKP